ncbi:MAG TPA: class I tRNA ligase family protein, partial [Candidatus Lokiarchaeia archaeon]
MKKKFYITTSIAYTNMPPHLGFALELIQADVLAKYHQLLGQEVFFLTGTDEHGLKVVKAAEKNGKEPKKFTDEIAAKYESLTKALNLSNTDFIRTTDEKRHWPKVKEIWLKLKENGDIYKKKYRGLYCVGCEAFITKKDLINGKCKIHQKEPEVIEEENYFFRLSKYSKKIE